METKRSLYVADPADANRCHGTFDHEQCWRIALPGSEFCRRHGGVDRQLGEAKRMYQLTEVELRNRLTELSQDNHIKSLKEEIGLCRLLIEQRLNSCKSDTDRMAATGAVNQLFLTLERLIKSCHNLDMSLGELLSKQAAMQLGQRIIELLIEELAEVEDHEAIIDRIVKRLMPTIEKANNDTQRLLPSPE